MRRTQTGEEINTCLRIRLVLNNGVNALVGQSSKNKSSVPCIKIQQDNVDLFISTLSDKVEESFSKAEDVQVSEETNALQILSEVALLEADAIRVLSERFSH
jgi:hypothetical protein